MVVLEEPYVSGMLLNYLEENKIPVLNNQFSKQLEANKLNFENESNFIEQYKSSNSKKIYTVSEYALNWVISELNDPELNKQIALLKNKTLFRQTIQSLYPDFFFQEVSYSDLFTLDVAKLRFPFVIKPSVGFLSAGVHTILDIDDWQNALDDIKKHFKKHAEKFPSTVVGDNAFLLESYINGKEFAIDVYFKDKEPVIVNIFEHPFSSVKDVSDRLYVTNKEIFDNYLDVFTKYVSRLNKALNLDNIPVHIELRSNGTSIIPIEINPLRFTGLCLNEINFYMTGKHPLYYYFSGTTPDYSAMWEGKDDKTFCFSIIEKPSPHSSNPMDINTIKSVYSDILEWRIVRNPKLDIQVFVFSKTNSLEELENILTLKV